MKKKEVKSTDTYNSGKENTEDNNNAPGPEINLYLNKDLKNNKEFRKKIFQDFFGYMKHYSKKPVNNIKIASSNDSETSDDRSPETTKRRKKNNIPTSGNIFQKKKKTINNNSTNKNLRKEYEIEQKDIEFESRVANISINSCYDNPYRDQYLKLINEKKRQNPGKELEFIIPQFSSPYMQQYPSPYGYNPYINQNMYMYPPQLQIPVSTNSQINTSQRNQQINQQFNSQMNYINPHINMQQFSRQIILPMEKNLNSPNNSPLNSQIDLLMSPQINQNINNNFFGLNNPHLLSPQSNNAPNPEHLFNNNDMDN